MEEITLEILKQAPFGYAYHKIILNESGIPVDYVFLDVNTAFEQMTGLKKENILGKKLTEILPGIKEDSFDWIGFYGYIALNGGKREFSQYSKELNRYYKITALSPKKYHFVTFFQDITAEMEKIKQLEEQQKIISKLTIELDTIFNSTHDAIFLVKVENGEFRYIRNNKAHQELTGFSLDMIKDKTPVEVAGKELGKILESDYKRCLETGAAITYEETLKMPAGEKVWLTSLTPVFVNGSIKYIVGSRKDITLQKKAEKEKEELLNRYQAMFNEHTAIMLIIEPFTGKILDANPAACSFYGYTKEELLKMHIQDINMLPKEEVEKKRLMALQKKQKYFVFPHRLKSGEIRLVDVYSAPINFGDKKVLFSIIFDVTEREELKRKLNEEKELLSITLRSIGDGVVATDSMGRIILMNKVAQEISGWNENEVAGLPFGEIFCLINEETGEKVESPIEKVLKSGKIIGLANHTALVTKDNRKISIADSAAPITDEKGNIFGVIMVFRDVSKEREWQEKILYLSNHDTLTGLYSRRYMEEKLKSFEQRKTSFAIIMADVNGLKLANDVFGHEEGDDLLKKAAEAIKESCRKEDVIARWGGDEFLILLPETNLKAAQEITEKIKDKCKEKSTKNLQLSMALGCSIKKSPEEKLEKVIKEAEEMMYRQKLNDSKSYRKSIINTLLATLFAKSTETKEHAERLQNCCINIGRDMGLSPKEIDELSLLAVLHDIGKVGIPEEILKKPSALSEPEWEEMKKHPEVGCRIAQNTPELVQIAEYILCHHERWDGKGYPKGLKGEEIPLLCRILAVVDAYDAMISDRPYRKALTREEAIAEIKKNAGTQFDPNIVEIFLKVLKKCTAGS
ncbi:PAS domain S-box protein [Thermovenabulum sp.]|uniref:PAS domain S-box protein n=1 Tax=Thermovenabulum sp. TaxID=3100335 RepID=UPI003C7C3D86